MPLAASPSVPLRVVVAVALAVICAAWAWSVLRMRHRRWRRQRRWRWAVQAETHASRLLAQQGYEVLGAQVRSSYDLVVDGVARPVALRADYVVARAGRTYVAEVKSGQRAPLLETAATRRQLLEYLVAFDVHGVLLIDGETRRVHEVVFPAGTDRAAAASPRGLSLPWAAVLMAIAAGSAWAVRSW